VEKTNNGTNNRSNEGHIWSRLGGNRGTNESPATEDGCKSKGIKEDIKANQARTEANHEEMTDKLDAHHESRMACCSEIFWSTDEGARGPSIRYREPRRTKGTDPGKCGSRKKLAAARKGTTRRLGVARRKKHGRQGQNKDDVAKGA
jgi:hypothetical protein